MFHTKRLGATFSQDLIWKKHVENIVNKVNKRVYAISVKACRDYGHGVRQCFKSCFFIGAFPEWYTNLLPKYLTDNIEIILKGALRCIIPGL